MGLDAVVYCDCFEKGRLREPPPFPQLVRLSEKGRPEIYTKDLSKAMIFDEWEARQPCQHECFVIVHHWIGNAALVSTLRSTLGSLAQQHKRQFPIIINKVVYSGIHCGDMLSREDVVSLQEEINQVFHILQAEENEELDRLKYFVNQMRELVEASLGLNKPIVF